MCEMLTSLLPKAPKVSAAPAAPQSNNEGIKTQSNDELRRRLAAQGRSSTILTSGLGTTGSKTSKKTLLGQ